MKNQAVDILHARPIVDNDPKQQLEGKVTIMGPFPPLIGTAAGHASALLHLFKIAGFAVRSATGPGLALARHPVSFFSERKLKESREFLDDCKGDDFAVLYAKSFDFQKISKPKWYKRRLEELRRLRFLGSVVQAHNHTAIVFDGNPLKSRYQLSLLIVLLFYALLRRGKASIFYRGEAPSLVLELLTGVKLTEPSAHRAEDSAYEAAAGDANGDEPQVRLTVARAERARRFWFNQRSDAGWTAIDRDLRELIAVAKRHDFRAMPQFRLLMETSDDFDGSNDFSAAFCATAHALYRNTETFGVPITRYMMHLRDALGQAKSLPLESRDDAERLLRWYLFDAGQALPSAVPVPAIVREHYLQAGKQEVPEPVQVNQVLPTKGRDKRPFAVSNQLAILSQISAYYLSKYNLDDPVDRIAFTVEALLSAGADTDCDSFLGPDALAYLQAPIGGNVGCLSRLEFLLGMNARFKLKGRKEIEKPWASGQLRNWVRASTIDVFPAIRNFLPKAVLQSQQAPRFSISGLPKSETGVGSNLHMSLSALRDIGLDPDVYDTADGMRKLEVGGAPPGVRRTKRSVALHHVNADLVPQTMISRPFLKRNDTYHIGFLLWEFDVLPQSHLLALDMLDEIWTPTRFLRKIYARKTNKPVHNVLKGLHIPEVAPLDLKAYGIPDGVKTFLTCFDFHSSVARKNPLAAVQAFQTAFPKGRDDVRIIVKTTPSVANHWGDPERQMARISELAKHDPRIVIVAEYVPFNKLLSLIAASDCLISPHRAEGFGLMPAYALGLRTPVMSTDYSGTTDFCTPDTCFPISYKKVKVGRQQSLFRLQGATWAEIDVDALSQNMRAFADCPDEGINRAAVGCDLIRTRFSPERQADRYRKRLTAIGAL